MGDPRNKSLHVQTKTVKGYENMNILEEKLMEVKIDLIEETIAIAPTYQTAKLIEEHYPLVEEAMREALRLIIKDIKEERRTYEDN